MHRAVELSVIVDGMEGRAGAGGREYSDHQAIRDDSSHRVIHG